MSMAQTIHGALWQGNEGREETLALRCGDESLTFGAFFDRIRRAEAGLRAIGVGAGDLVTIFSLGTPETIIAFYAIDRIGAVANWVDMKVSPSEVEQYLLDAQSRVVLALEIAFTKIYEHRGNAPAEYFVSLPLAPYIPSRLAEKLHTESWKKNQSPFCLSWEDFLQEPTEDEPETERFTEAAVITYTGGTTGPAKGVTLSRRAFHASLLQYIGGETEYGKGGSNLALLPPFAAFGLCQCIHVPLCLGMTVILTPLFQPDELGDLLVRYRPEQVSGTTSYWQLLLRSKAAETADLSFLKVPRSGGDAISLEMEKRLNRFLAERGCKAKLIKEYGMSEVCGIVCLNYGDSRREGSVGRPLPGCHIVAVHPETDVVLPCGEQGELIICSDTVMNGYYGRPEADGEVLKQDAEGRTWVYTKDIGYIEPDGSVVITGRKKRLISRNGFKIFPIVIEECLLGTSFVEACAVVGAESPKGECLPVAHIVPSEGVQPEAVEQTLRARCREHLNHYMLPAAYRFRTELPLTERGKLDYRALEQESHLE